MIERTMELAKKATQHFMGPFGLVEGKVEIILERGEGCYVWDTNGNKYLDICSVTQSLNLGYGRKEIHDAIVKQLNKIEFVFSMPPYGNDLVIEYAEELAKVTPKNINHFFFTVCGTESIEIAINIAKLYWYIMGKPSKYKVVCLTNAYHGSSQFAASFMGNPTGRIPYGPEAPGVVRIPDYYCYRCQFGLKYPDCELRCAHFLQQTIEAEGEDSIAAFIAEPEQGSAGAIAPPPDYWPLVRRICTEHNILLIDDEVMTGFCRTGKMFAIQHWHVEPDLMAMAKGISSAYVPMGGVGISDKIWEAIRGTVFYHGHSYSGHPISCAAARAALDIYVKERVADHTADIGTYVKKRLEKDFLPLPNISEITGLGLLLGIGIVADKKTKAKFPKEFNLVGILNQECLKAGLFVRTRVFRDGIVFSPPLTITKEEADKGLDLLYHVLVGLKK
jgi:4-aminobutyrate--pyruvate transaminase